MKSKHKGKDMQYQPLRTAPTVPFAKLQLGEQFKLPSDGDTLKLGILTKGSPYGFTSMWNGIRFSGNSRSEDGYVVNVGQDFPVERIEMQ